MKKGQIAAEFMVVFGIFLVGIILIVFAVWNSVGNAEKAAVDLEANRVLGIAASRINTVYLGGDGFSIGLAIPEKIGVYDYEIQFDGNLLMIELGQYTYADKLLTRDITGTLAKGENTISNVNGTVVIS
jgi:hypothetical protein